MNGKELNKNISSLVHVLLYASLEPDQIHEYQSQYHTGGSDIKFSVILGNLGNTKDRFLSSGYKASPTLEDMFKQASSIEDVRGVELVGSWDIATEMTKELRSLLF